MGDTQSKQLAQLNLTIKSQEQEIKLLREKEALLVKEVADLEVDRKSRLEELEANKIEMDKIRQLDESGKILKTVSVREATIAYIDKLKKTRKNNSLKEKCAMVHGDVNEIHHNKPRNANRPVFGVTIDESHVSRSNSNDSSDLSSNKVSANREINDISSTVNSNSTSGRRIIDEGCISLVSHKLSRSCSLLSSISSLSHGVSAYGNPLDESISIASHVVSYEADRRNILNERSLPHDSSVNCLDLSITDIDMNCGMSR